MSFHGQRAHILLVLANILLSGTSPFLVQVVWVNAIYSLRTGAALSRKEEPWLSVSTGIASRTGIGPGETRAEDGAVR